MVISGRTWIGQLILVGKSQFLWQLFLKIELAIIGVNCSTYVLNCQTSGSSVIGTFTSQKISQSGLFTNPATELPDFGNYIKTKLSDIRDQK